MCGISGYINLPIDKQQKLMLVLGLADGIDGRGGHSCGYVSVSEDNNLYYARKTGTLIRSRLRFLQKAADHVCLMHARFATCGDKEHPMNAHPFAIRRNGRVVMWGVHNGMVPDAFQSAKKNGRDINVDSQEIFELIADGNIEGLNDLSGYGVIAWIERESRDHIFLAKLSNRSDICVVSIKGGGIVWGSTWKIVKDALKFADLEVDREFKIDEIGRVYRISANGVYKTPMSGVKVGSYAKSSSKTYYPSSTVKKEDEKKIDETAEVIDENALVETKTPGEFDYYGSHGRSYHNEYGSKNGHYGHYGEWYGD